MSAPGRRVEVRTVLIHILPRYQAYDDGYADDSFCQTDSFKKKINQDIGAAQNRLHAPRRTRIYSMSILNILSPINPESYRPLPWLPLIHP